MPEDKRNKDHHNDVIIEIPETVFDDAVTALSAFMFQTIYHSLQPETHATRMTIFRAMLNAFYQDEKFSLKKTATLGSSLVIGLLAGAYCLQPAKDGAETVFNILRDIFDADVPFKPFITRVLQAANMTESTALSTFSAFHMIHAYFGETTPAETFLTFHAATCSEKASIIGRKTFDLLCAIAANIPTFLLTKDVSIVFALLTALTNVGVAWMGVSSLPLTPQRVYPAKRVELAYLNEQLNAFLQLPLHEQQVILNNMEAITRQTPHTHKTHKQIWLRLFDLSKPLHQTSDDAIDAHTINVHAPQPTSLAKDYFAKSLGVVAAASELTFAEVSGYGTAQMLTPLGATEPPMHAILAGITTALLALLPCIGFGYTGGQAAGNAMTSTETPLAQLANLNVRRALKWLSNLIAACSGATLFQLGTMVGSDIVALTDLQKPLDDIIKISSGLISYTGAAVENGYYALSLLDDILIYFAQVCGDDSIRRLFHFVQNTRRFYHALATTNEENYIAILKWKVEIRNDTSHTEEDRALSNLLHGLFDQRLTESEYVNLQKDTDNIVKNRTELPHYRVIKPILSVGCNSLFSRCAGRQKEESVNFNQPSAIFDNSR